MKQLKYIIIAFIAGCILYGCSEDPIDKSMSSSDFFVTFDTRSGETNNVILTEGDTCVVSISIGATRGSSITVDFDVETPSGLDPESVAYTLLTMDNNVMTGKTLTFPEGTGKQSFKLVTADNSIEDGTRTITLKLIGNSANYRNGVNARNEGATLPIVIRDDEYTIEMEELVGTWTVTENMYYSGAWHNGEVYSMTVAQIGTSSSITISGIAGGDDVDVVTAEVTLEAGVLNKYISLPAQDIIPTWQSPYITHFCALTSSTFADNIGKGFTDERVMRLVKIDGVISLQMRGGFSTYSWAVLALNADRSSAGAFMYANASVWEKN